MERILLLISIFVYVSEAEGQVNFGFGFGQPGQQTIGGTVNSFLGGLFGTSNQAQVTCNHNNGGCQHYCEMVGGQAQCYCEFGYYLSNDRFSCLDADECASPDTNVCDEVCTNTPGSFHCSCSSGATLQPDGMTCSFGLGQPTSSQGSCQINNGGCEQKCKDRRGFVKCKCRKGFQLANDGFSCFDINECDNPGVCPGTCTNTEGSYICEGSQGATSCEVNNGGCEHKCKYNRQGIMRCKCDRGFELAADGRSCTERGSNRDPCAKNNGGCQHNCLVENGHKICTCNNGFELVKNKKCRPIQGQVDPCDTVRCHHKCENINGRAVCICHQGYDLINGFCELNQQNSNLQSCSSKQSSLPAGCGSSMKNPTFTRIVGGRKSNPEDWPFIISIMVKLRNSSICGGVIIKPQYVLSAAHCSNVFTADELKVRLGEYDFSRTDDNCPEDHDILKIILHEEYNPTTNQNDIAILQMTTPVRYNAYIQPICLPLPSHNPIGKPGYVIGWGTTSFLGSTSDILLETALPTWTQAECETAYPKKIYDGMMCAGSRDGKRDSCQGDSGGPLMHFSGTRWHIAGIVSWGEGCATVNRPGVYTQVNKYLLWISTHT